MAKGSSAVRVAWNELEAAFEDWRREYGLARKTLRYEDLLPVADRLNQTLEELLEASEPLIGRVAGPAEHAPAHVPVRSVQPDNSQIEQLTLRIATLHESARRLRVSTIALEEEMRRSQGLMATAKRAAGGGESTTTDKGSH